MFNNLIRRFFADDVELNLGSGGKTIATLDVAGVQHEKVINEFLVAGVPVMVDAANPLPVTDAAAEAALASIAAEDFATQTTLAALLAKVIAAPSTEAKQDAIITLLTTIATITQPLTDTQLRATPVPVSGTVTANTGLAQPLTDTQLRATPVPVSGTLFGGAVTIADGADVTLGALADAIVAAGATGSISAKLRRATQGLEDLKTLIVLAAGSAIIGKVGIDQTTPGTTNAVQLVPPTTIFNGKKTVTTAGTRVTLAASQAVKSVTIRALSTNTGFIYVGDTSVASTNGFQLSAGDTVSMDLSNLNTVNLDSSVNGEGVSYIAVN